MNPLSLFPPLWHRRAASVVLLLCLFTLVSASYNLIHPAAHASVMGAMVPVVLAFTGAVMSLGALLPIPDRYASVSSLIGYYAAITALAIAIVIVPESSLHVIFIVLYGVIVGIAGIYGPLAWVAGAGFNAWYLSLYFVTESANHPLSASVTNVIIYTVPLFASWLLWRNGYRRPAALTSDTAHSTLAEQLNQVANESDIVINTIADGVLALNGRGEIQLINPAAQKTLGWSKSDSLGLDFRSIIKLQDTQGNPVPDERNPVFISLHTSKPGEFSDLNMVTNANRTFQARLSITPVSASGGGVIIVFRDITKEKAEEREQAEFVSTASHEMRTPVAAIEGYLGLALNPQTAAIDDKARMFLTKAHESSQHLGRLFQDLLDVTKADDGRLRNLPAVTDLAQFCADIVNGLTAKAAEKGLTLSFEPLHDADALERKLAPVYYADFDNDHLREVLSNLIDNAIKYTKSGTVRVNVSGDADSTEVSVKDSGIGIPREDIPHLFQKFYRVDNSDTREIGGTGLGLYLSRRLVELMGGKIWVESEYGQGSTFVVSLPRLSFEVAQARLRALAEQRERQAANERTAATREASVKH